MAWGRGDKSPKVDGGGGSSSSNASSSIGSNNAKDVDAGGDAHWFIQNEIVQFALMNTNEIKYMCMIGYTFLHGCKVFKKLENPDYSSAYKFISMILACTGGGILVPIFLNTIPVPLAIDAYPIAILISFGLHTYFPVLREVVELSSIFKGMLIVFYETIRAYVVTLFVGVAATTIPASQFAFPLFGPIICGTIGGCGGAFLPFNIGLDPLKNGLPPPVFSAFVGATFYHLFTTHADSIADHLEKNVPVPLGPFMTELVKGVANEVGKVIVVVWFIGYAFYKNNIFGSRTTKKSAAAVGVAGAASRGKKGKAIKTEKKE